MTAALNYVAYYKQDTDQAYFYAVLAIVFFTVVNGPDTVKLRPHSLFWRALLGVFLSYSMFMTLVLVLPKEDGRNVFKIFDKNLGKKLEERSYAEDCRVYTPEKENKFHNIYDAVVDVHFIAHFAGWWFKMHITRDWYACWIISITFELIEISFKHLLPNFAECWWDHVSTKASDF